MSRDSPKTKRYFAVRWTWATSYTIDELRESFTSFRLTLLNKPTSGFQDAIHAGVWGAPKKKLLEAEADTVTAQLSPINAEVFQKRGREGAFTERDKELIDHVFKLYPHWRSWPLAVHPPVEYWYS